MLSETTDSKMTKYLTKSLTVISVKNGKALVCNGHSEHDVISVVLLDKLKVAGWEICNQV